MTRRAMVAGNWKMNGQHGKNQVLVKAIVEGRGASPDVEVVICPPLSYVAQVAWQVGTAEVAVGSQDVSDQVEAGAFTGEVSGTMLADVGCRYVIVGHSERRALFGEDDALVARKFSATLAAGLVPILCLGESLQEREAGETHAVLARQLDAVVTASGIEAFEQAVIAYEPVWAIGTGQTASPEQAQAVHAFLRSRLAGADARIAAALRLLYGGSVKADNAASLFSQPDVDGGLIGGASLKSDQFLAICAAAQGRTE